ncbi:glycerophosphodiester phosphodiesterase [Methanobacterium sp. ACI-7]|uniref:glycerophosphodiester phosphodiesterase n=1 Tax=unclassified Methanobacterium TaxID=2627676 RepID=UPI0039C3ADA2
MEIIAHRGASYFEPENTLRAYKKAIEMGADFVETDVRITKDKELVIMHDADILRTTNGKGLVKNFTLEELKKFDAGLGERIPTLEEVIKLVKNKINLIVEIKEPGTEGSIIKKIEEFDLENTILTSFYHKTVKNVRSSSLDINAGIIFVGEPLNVGRLASDVNANVIFPSYKYMTQELVKNAKKYALTIYPWAIDEEEIFNKFAKMGIDGIVTNKLI